MIRNLGQVAAIYIGSSAPRNTNLIWLDNTVVPFVFRAYDGSAWSEIATHKWVRAYVDGWLVTLPPRQLADDGDYMLINSNNVNYKITVKDFVKSAVGNPLDFKGVIRVSADFPNPSTLESGDMYVIITSPAGGTVTDPYSGKTFEDSEKIVWDEVTQSWESLGKIDITVDLTTSYSETEVTIHSSAGKETTIQGATDQLAGVMLPGQYSWLQALSNGSIVPGDPSPLTPLTPAHKHNYNDIINRLVSQQGTGESTIDPMSQKATTDALNLKFDKASVLQVSGAATDKVMSQKAVTDALKTLSDDFNNKLTNYLPLAGGTMKGNIGFPIGNGIACNDVTGTAAYIVLRTWNVNNSTRMYVGTVNFPTYISSTASDLIHDRNGLSYLLWDSYNLPTPASTTDLANYLPLIGGTLTGQLTIKQSVDIKLRLQSTDADNHCIIQAINSQASQLGVFGYAGDKWVIGHGGTYYEIWDKYNLTNPVTYTTNTYNHATLTNKDGQYFTYIKAGTNGLLPHSKVALASGGSGFLGTSDQSFNAAYINNLHTNKISFGVNGPYIIGSTSATQFLDANGGVQKVATGSLYVGTSYASDALSLVPANGIYSSGAIKSATGFTSNSRQTSLNLAKTGNDVLYISSFVNGATGSPGTDSNTGRTINDGMFLTYFWQNDNAFQLVADIDGTGMAYRHYAPSTGNSTTGWKFLADTNWVVSKINSSTSNFLKKTGDTATGQIILDSNGIAFKANTWTNDLAPNRNYSGYLQVLDAYDVSSAGGPTNYGTVLQVNSRNAHWANQLWFPGGAKASKNGLYYRHMSYNETTYGNWIKLATTSDLGNYLPLTGGKLTSTSSAVLTIDSTGANETYMRVSRNGTSSAAIGFMDGLGAYIYNNNSSRYLFIGNDGYARVGTTSGSTRIALITDIPSVSGYATQSWCNSKFAPLTNFTLTSNYATIKGNGNEICIGNTSQSSASAYMIINYRVPTGCTYAPSAFYFKAGSAKSWADIYAGGIYMSSNLVATQTWSSGQFPTKTGTGASGTWGISITGNATTATTASKLGSTTIGGSAKPIYLSSGTPTACSATVGSATVPVYMNAGTITQCSTTLGVSITGNAATATNATQLGGTAASSYVKANDNISRLTNDSGFITSSALNGYATQAWVNSQNFVKSTSTKKVTDIQPVDALPATQASGVLYLVFG